MVSPEYDDLLKKLHDVVDSYDSDIDSASHFTKTILDHLIEIGRVDDGEVASWEGAVGRGLVRINGYGVSEQNDMLDLFICDVGGPDAVRTLRADDLDRLVGQAGRFAEMSLKLREMPDADEAATAMFKAIKEVRGKLRRVRIFVLTDGLSAARRWPKREVEGLPAEIEIWDLTRLVRSMAVEGGGEPIDIDFENSERGCQPYVRLDSSTEHSTILMMVTGDMLSDLYEEHGAALLEFNVRSFLSVRGAVNKGIRDTILSYPERFVAYNNGIVITADSVYERFLPGIGKAIAKLMNVQIVNGGQTTATIHDAARRHGADVSRVAVAAKIVIVGSADRDDMVKQISKYANTQNTMQQADLSANEPFHISVEHLSRATWCPGGDRRWFYERARGQYDVELSRHSETPVKRAKFLRETPKELRFSKVDLARYLGAWSRRPHEVSLGGQKNFAQFMEEMRRRNGLSWEPDQQWYQDVIAVATIWRSIEKVVRWEGVPAFRANVTAYLMAKLSSHSSSRLDLRRVWNTQAISTELEAMLRSWVMPVRNALVDGAASRQRNPTEWFKKPECWAEVERLAVPLPLDMPPEFSEGRRDVDLLPAPSASTLAAELAAAQRVKSLDAQKWIRIAEWGGRTGRLHWRQTGIATSMSGLAAQQWRRDPSPKQLNAALTILNVVEQYAPELLE